MDYSPDESSKQKVPLQEITDRLVGALDISGDTVFPDSKDYFTSIKAELRKIMKQKYGFSISRSLSYMFYSPFFQRPLRIFSAWE